MRQIVEVIVQCTHETCERYTYYVTLKSDDGYFMYAEAHATGSIYTNGEGLSREEARDRALIDAACWGDFLDIMPTEFIEDGVTYKPSIHLTSYTRLRGRWAG